MIISKHIHKAVLLGLLMPTFAFGHSPTDRPTPKAIPETMSAGLIIASKHNLPLSDRSLLVAIARNHQDYTCIVMDDSHAEKWPVLCQLSNSHTLKEFKGVSASFIRQHFKHYQEAWISGGMSEETGRTRPFE